MSSRAERKNSDEQYQLILECRSSGMTDYQWCKEHNINPGTFYNWVKRLRQKNSASVPEPAGKDEYKPSEKQDIVQLQILDDRADIIPVVADSIKQPAVNSVDVCVSPIMITIGQSRINLTNDVDPSLFMQILHYIGDQQC